MESFGEEVMGIGLKYWWLCEGNHRFGNRSEYFETFNGIISKLFNNQIIKNKF